MSQVIACDNITIDANGVITCPDLTTVQIIDADTLSIGNLTEVLNSINEFDPAIVASLIAAYLTFFIIGYSAGMVARIMKKA